MQLNYSTPISSAKDGISVQIRGKLKYCFGVFKRIETSFNLIYYPSHFDARIKSNNTLKLQPQLKTYFSFKL